MADRELESIFEAVQHAYTHAQVESDQETLAALAEKALSLGEHAWELSKAKGNPGNLEIPKLPKEHDAIVFEDRDHKQFCWDMGNAGHKVFKFETPVYSGPAVEVNAIIEATARTNVSCIWALSKAGRWIVHPSPYVTWRRPIDNKS